MIRTDAARPRTDARRLAAVRAVHTAIYLVMASAVF